MTIHKIVTKNESYGLKFTIFKYFIFGTFFMVLLEKIWDLQEQLRSVQQEIRLLISE